MTWLRGQTTWLDVVDKLTKLACGEVADDSAVTAAVGDRWTRDIGAGNDLIRSHASGNVASGTLANRGGYWSLVSPIGDRTVLKQANLSTSLAASVTRNRWLIVAQVTQVNSVAGDYSTARVGLIGWNPDTGSSFGGLSNFTPNAAGHVTASATFGSIQFDISHPTGIVTLNAFFVRAFTTTYLGGIDWWPMLYRKAAAPTWVTAPAGVAGVDYDIVELPISTTGFAGSVGAAVGSYAADFGFGLGYRTAVPMDAAKYEFSFPIAWAKLRLVRVTGTNNGRIRGIFGHSSVDPFDATTLVINHGYDAAVTPNGFGTAGSMLRPYQTPGAVTDASLIQYWMSVKADRLLIVLNADPGQSGKLACGGVFSFAPLASAPNPQYDVLPACISWNAEDLTTNTQRIYDPITSYTWQELRRRQDGSEAPRDWQTKWNRCDAIANDGRQLRLEGGNTNPLSEDIVPARAAKPSPRDGKWWLYSYWVSDVALESGSSTPPILGSGTVDTGWRGTLRDAYYIPSEGWSSGDELDAGADGKFFLVAADYHGLPGRKFSASTAAPWGGTAIRED